jgi:hypothetical protein
VRIPHLGVVDSEEVALTVDLEMIYGVEIALSFP